MTAPNANVLSKEAIYQAKINELEAERDRWRGRCERMAGLNHHDPKVIVGTIAAHIETYADKLDDFEGVLGLTVAASDLRGNAGLIKQSIKNMEGGR